MCIKIKQLPVVIVPISPRRKNRGYSTYSLDSLIDDDQVDRKLNNNNNKK